MKLNFFIKNEEKKPHKNKINYTRRNERLTTWAPLTKFIDTKLTNNYRYVCLPP